MTRYNQALVKLIEESIASYTETGMCKAADFSSEGQKTVAAASLQCLQNCQPRILPRENKFKEINVKEATRVSLSDFT